jgi:3-phenylpropionate/trans-cinnamate dioxygenase ferredoxin reductase subunit
MSAEASLACIVIVGAGQAGGELATALRQQGFAGRVVLIGDEPYVPYRRPPLSKTFLSGDTTLDSLLLKPRTAYEKHDIECLTGVRVTAIDRAAHTVTLEDGRSIRYDKLALTTGGRPRLLPLAGADKPNVHYVRTIDDIERMRAQFTPGSRLVIIGGGYIGLEAASVGIKKGLSVTVVEAMPRVLARVTAPEVSAFYERVHRGHGVDVRTGVGVAALHGGERVESVELADGTVLPADVVIVGVGLIPNTELAEDAGLEVSNGIVVDQYERTSDPDIVAAGDCANSDNGFLGRRFRLESVPNAIEQGRLAAGTLCGKLVPYKVAPWFWSDQYDLKLQMVGINQGYDRIVIHGSMDANRFVAFYLKDNLVIAADAVNQPQEFMVAKRLVGERIPVDPSRLADPALVLKTLLPPKPAA